MNWMHVSLASLGCPCGNVASAPPVLTALQALKIAQRRLRPNVRESLVSVCSAPTNSTFAPEAWRFIFSDTGTRKQYRSVIVAAKSSSEHPDVLEAFRTSRTETKRPLTRISLRQIALDSDDALARVRSISPLRGHFSAVYWLFLSKKEREPVWHLSFYAKARDPVISYRVRTRSGAILPIEQGVYDS